MNDDINDYIKNLEILKTNYNIVLQTSKDLEEAAKLIKRAMDISINPLKIAIDPEGTQKELNEIATKITAHFIIASNNIATLTEYNENRKEK